MNRVVDQVVDPLGANANANANAPQTAIVVGSGVGGLCAGARLAAAGTRVTVVERLRQVGGRWSTREIDGFKIPTGATPKVRKAA